MPKLSISAAWNESADILRRDGGLLYMIAFAFAALPGVAMQFVMPQSLAVPVSADSPQGLPPGSGWLLLIFPVLVLSLWGSLAISTLALGVERVVGPAFGHAARRIPALLGASLLSGLAACLLAIPFLVATGPRLEPSDALFLLAFVTVMLLLWVKLMLTVPVAAAERAGPFAILARSWRLTAGHYWTLLGFVLLAMLVGTIVMLVAGSVGGLLVLLVAGRPAAQNFASLLTLLLSGAINAGLVTVFTVMLSRIYARLAGLNAGDQTRGI